MRQFKFCFGMLPSQPDQLNTSVRQHARYGKGAFQGFAPGHQFCAKRQLQADLRPALNSTLLPSFAASYPLLTLKHVNV